MAVTELKARQTSISQDLRSEQKTNIAIFNQVKRLADVDIKPIGGFEVKNETAMQKVEISSKVDPNQKHQLTLAIDQDSKEKLILEGLPNSYIFFEKSNFPENTSIRLSRAFEQLGDNFAGYRRQELARIHSAGTSTVKPQ